MPIDLRDISLDEIYDFIENGIPEQQPDIVKYMVEMEKVRGMTLRIDKYASKDAIVNHLVKVDGYKKDIALNLYYQTLEYFYADSTISKQAWRNIYAEKMEKVVNFAIGTMKDTSDAAKVNRMILEMGRLRQLDQPDLEDLPEGLFDKPFKLYTLDPEMVGIPKADRREVAAFIDELPDLSELQKEILKREAGELPFRAFLEPHEDPRNNEE